MSFETFSVNSQNFFWWKEPDKEIHKSVFQYIKFLDNKQSYRQADNIKFLRLYGNCDFRQLKGYSFVGQHHHENSSIHSRVTMNIVQSMVDTVVSKITKNRPKPTFLTDGGDWSLQQRAKKLSKFSEGQFQATNFYREAAKAYTEAASLGTGAVKIFKQNNEIKAEKVFIDEIIVDDNEALYSDPRQIHQRKLIHKDVLKEMFPKAKTMIDAETDTDIGFGTVSQTLPSEMITVIESWHLPSGKDAKDGKHAITIRNHTLLAEEWKHDFFPFVFWKWNERSLGFFGQGIGEQLQGLQLEINKILRTIQVSMHLVSIPKIFVEASSKVVSAHINNRIGGIIKYAGTKPTHEVLGRIPPELFSHLDRLYGRAFEIVGVSQLSAQSQKPAGLDSGKALREFNDIETERFMDAGLRYEKSFMDASKIMIALAKEINEKTNGFKVKVKGKKFLETIKWSEVDLDEEKYLMQVFPTSVLSSTPAGRLQDVQELVAAGFIQKEDAQKLLDFPDLEAYYNFNNAGLEDIERTIEIMIDKGDYVTPEPFQNLELGIVKMQQAYLLFRSQNAPDSRLELFRRWIEDANSLRKQATDAAREQQIAAQAAQQTQLPVPGTGEPALEQTALIEPEPTPESENLNPEVLTQTVQ